MTITPEHVDLLNIRAGISTIEMSAKGIKFTQIKVEGTSVVIILEPVKDTRLYMPHWVAFNDYTYWIYTVDVSPFWLSLVQDMQDSTAEVKLAYIKRLCNKVKMTEDCYQMVLDDGVHRIPRLLSEGKLDEAKSWLNDFKFKPEDITPFIMNLYAESVSIGRQQIKEEINDL